jgi:hypothetical protein
MTNEIDIDAETVIGLFQVPEHYPGPRKPSRATVFRWTVQGVRVSGTDDRVKLASVKLCGIRCTSLEALSRFLRESNEQSSNASEESDGSNAHVDDSAMNQCSKISNVDRLKPSSATRAIPNKGRIARKKDFARP